MVTRILPLLVLFMSAMTVNGNSSLAGGKESHGGVVVACMTTLENPKLLDLEEGRGRAWNGTFRRGPLVIPEVNSLPVDQQFQKAFARMRFSPSLYRSLQESYGQIRKRVTFTEIGSRYPFVWGGLTLRTQGTREIYHLWVHDVYGFEFADQLFVTINPGCSLFQVALYSEDEGLWLDRFFYNGLSNTGKAALFFHEAAYHLTRECLKTKDSVNARRLTALAFDTSLSEPDFQAEVTELLKVACPGLI